MLRLDVLQNQWLFLALLGGTALVVVVLLSYLAVWRARDDHQAQPDQPPAAHEHSPMPWILIFTYVVTAAWALAYVWMQATRK